MANNNQVIIEKAPSERVLKEMVEAIRDADKKGEKWRGCMEAVYKTVVAHGVVK